MNSQVYPPWVTTASEQKLHDDFRAFVWLLWRHLKLPPPTRRQLAIARYLQYGNRRRMVQAFRGIGKSWLTCAYALWRLYRNPNERVKIVSANEDKAIENATFMRRLIEEVDQLKFLRPKSGRDSVLAFDVGPADPHPTASVSCVGITGQLTGGRASILISDDVEVPKNSYTETMREKLSELVKEYDALVVPEGFDIIYLGTPQTEQSIYNQVRTRGYDCKIWPARYPSGDAMVKFGNALADDILLDLQNGVQPGTSTDPERFSDLDLAERESSYGRSGFALQFMLDTSLSDAERYPLKLADLVVMDVPREMGPVRVEWTSDPRNAITDLANPGFSGDRFYRPLQVSPERSPWEGCVMYIDPSGRGKDETGWVVLRHMKGTLYLVGAGGFREGYSDATLQGLAKIAQEHEVTQVLTEPDFGDGMFLKLLTPVFARLYPCSIEEADRAQGQKERRIIGTLEPVLNQHRLVVDTRVIKTDLAQSSEDPRYSLFYQMTHLTVDRGSLRHDDRIDALAGAVGYFRDQMERDVAQAREAHLEALREKDFGAFIESALGSRPSPSRYADRPVVSVRRN